MTQPDPADPLRDAYGDAPLVQSRAPSGTVRTRIQDISTALEGQLVRFLAKRYERYPAMRHQTALALGVWRLRPSAGPGARSGPLGACER